MSRLLLLCCLWLLNSSPAIASPLDGDWFIWTGRNEVFTSNPKHPAGNKLKALGKKADLKGLAFTAQEDWVILWGGNGIEWNGDFPSLGRKVRELWKVNADFKCLAFTPQGGWALLYNQNDFASDGIPARARARLQDVKKAGGALRSIAFAPQGGWVILADNAIFREGLAKDLDKIIVEQIQQRREVRCVAFTSQGAWFVLNGRNEWFASNTSHPAARMLQQLRARGVTLKGIAFSPGEWVSGYVLQRKPVKRIKAELTFDIDEPAGKVEEWVFYAPQAPALDRQRDVETTFIPAGKPVQEESPLKRGFLLARVNDKPRGIKTKTTYEMTLYSTRLVPRPVESTAARVELDSSQIAFYTRSSVAEDFKAKSFQEWLDRVKLRRGDKESDMTFARRGYSYLKHHLQYEYRPEGMDRRASAVCRGAKADCGGMSILFVAVLRANRVPARSVWGRWALSEIPPRKKGELPDPQCHVKAEFFAVGVGWVPVDMAAGVADRDRELAAFGNDGGDFVVMHLDVEMVLDTFQGKKDTTWWQQAPWWSRRGGSGKGERFEEHWKVEKVSR